MEQLLKQFIESLEESFKLLEMASGGTEGLPNITISQINYITVIYQNPGSPISEIAAKLGYSRASVTIAIDKLVKAGLVTKTRSAKDRRVYHVYLTDTAQQLVDSKQHAIKKYSAHILNVLDPTETKLLSEILIKILAKKNKIDVT
jgi:DNA-binding MarR family transcriptional regulator